MLPSDAWKQGLKAVLYIPGISNIYSEIFNLNISSICTNIEFTLAKYFISMSVTKLVRYHHER